MAGTKVPEIPGRHLRHDRGSVPNACAPVIDTLAAKPSPTAAQRTARVTVQSVAIASTMPYHFATYFDVNYLPRAVALYRSLERHTDAFTLHALCLDQTSLDAVARLGLPHLRAYPLATMEAADPELLAIKPTRTLVEYYFTCTAAFVAHLFRTVPDLEELTYLDADLYFYSDPAPIRAAMGAGSVLIVGHRFPDHARELERFGRYNVGLIVFRNTPDGRACLAWWRERCLEWCYDRLEGDRFGDQKYLERWSELFTGVVELRHKGANLAPWNLARYRITQRDGAVMVDDEPLIFYHFHKLRARGRRLFGSGIRDRRAALSAAVRNRIYAPYLRALGEAVDLLGGIQPRSLRGARHLRATARVRMLLEYRLLYLVGARALLIDLHPLLRLARVFSRVFHA
jgi:hypothetical protein